MFELNENLKKFTYTIFDFKFVIPVEAGIQKFSD
jgi:hypothetical protein